MAQSPSKRWYWRQPSIVCFLLFIPPFKKINKKKVWNCLLLFFICQSKIMDVHIERCTGVGNKIQFMNLHGSEVLVSRAFEASQDNIAIFRFTSAHLITMQNCWHCSNIIYLNICLLKNVGLGWTRSLPARPLRQLCFDKLCKPKFEQQSLIFTGVRGSEINSVFFWLH